MTWAMLALPSLAALALVEWWRRYVPPKTKGPDDAES